MKQRLFVCMVLVASMLAACKNEDIDISRKVSFDVHPYTAVSDFVRYEVNPGDLSAFKYDEHPDHYQLRTYLLVYDADGKLVNSRIDDLKNFNDRMSASFELLDGYYTVVSLCHVYCEKEALAYWSVQDMESLSSLKLLNNDDYYDDWTKALGLKTVKVEVGCGLESHTVNLQPAVALMVNYFLNIHYYPNIKAYRPYANKMPKMISFNDQGECHAIYEESVEPNYPLTSPLETNVSSDNLYWYYCFTPLKTTNFKWVGQAMDGQVYTLGETRSADIRAGKVYQSVINLQTGVFKIEELKEGKEFLLLDNCNKMDMIINLD